MKNTYFLILALILTICSSSYAQQRFQGQNKDKVAIYVKSGSTTKVSSYEREIESIITNNIIQSNKFAVIERNNDFLATVQKEIDYQLSGDVLISEISKIGAQHGVKHIIAIDYTLYYYANGNLHGNVDINAKWINVETAQVFASRNVKVDRSSRFYNLKDGVEYLSSQLIGSILYPGLQNIIEIRGPFYYARDLNDRGINHPNKNMVMITNPHVVKYLLVELQESGYENLYRVSYACESAIEQTKKKTRNTYYLNAIERLPHQSLPQRQQFTCSYVYNKDKIIDLGTIDYSYTGTHILYCPANFVSW